MNYRNSLFILISFLISFLSATAAATATATATATANANAASAANPVADEHSSMQDNSSPRTPHALKLQCAEDVEMGTRFRICLVVLPSNILIAENDIRQAFAKIREINAWMSDWLPETELQKVNQAAGAHSVIVRSELFNLLEWSQGISRETKGAFDITFNAFWGLYKFKPGEYRAATDEEIAERKALVDYRMLHLNRTDRTAYLQKPGMKIGLGAIGQGYACDIVAERLKKKYSGGYIDGSGDTLFWGRKPSGEMWLTSIRDPRNHQLNIASIYGSDFAITTSGDDEKFFFQDNTRIHHIIDPRTGRPSIGTHQVTVIAPTALEADTLDTALMILGPEKGMEIVHRHGVEAVFVTDKQVIHSPGLKAIETKSTRLDAAVVWRVDKINSDSKPIKIKRDEKEKEKEKKLRAGGDASRPLPQSLHLRAGVSGA